MTPIPLRAVFAMCCLVLGFSMFSTLFPSDNGPRTAPFSPSVRDNPASFRPVYAPVFVPTPVTSPDKPSSSRRRGSGGYRHGK